MKQKWYKYTVVAVSFYSSWCALSSSLSESFSSNQSLQFHFESSDLTELAQVRDLQFQWLFVVCLVWRPSPRKWVSQGVPGSSSIENLCLPCILPLSSAWPPAIWRLNPSVITSPKMFIFSPPSLKREFLGLYLSFYVWLLGKVIFLAEGKGTLIIKSFYSITLVILARK